MFKSKKLWLSISLLASSVGTTAVAVSCSTTSSNNNSTGEVSDPKNSNDNGDGTSDPENSNDSGNDTSNSSNSKASILDKTTQQIADELGSIYYVKTADDLKYIKSYTLNKESSTSENNDVHSMNYDGSVLTTSISRFVPSLYEWEKNNTFGTLLGFQSWLYQPEIKSSSENKLVVSFKVIKINFEGPDGFGVVISLDPNIVSNKEITFEISDKENNYTYNNDQFSNGSESVVLANEAASKLNSKINVEKLEDLSTLLDKAWTGFFNVGRYGSSDEGNANDVWVNSWVVMGKIGLLVKPINLWTYNNTYINKDDNSTTYNFFTAVKINNKTETELSVDFSIKTIKYISLC